MTQRLRQHARDHARGVAAAFLLGGGVALTTGTAPAAAAGYGLVAVLSFVAWSRVMARYHTGSWLATTEEVRHG